MTSDIKAIKFDKGASLKEKNDTLNKIIDSTGGRKPKTKDANLDDKITIELTRLDCAGIVKAMDGTLMVSSFGLVHKMTEHALNRSVWTHEFGSNGTVDKEIEEVWNKGLALDRATRQMKEKS